MDRKHSETSRAVALGPESIIALGLAIFYSFAKLLGVYFAISFSIILTALAFDVLKFILAVLRVLFSKRPDGTSFTDALYYDVGRGEQMKGTIPFGIMLTLLGIGLVYFSKKPEGSMGLRDLISQNPMGVVGGLAFGIGLAVLYWGVKGILKKMFLGSIYYEEPEVKQMKAEMMTAFKQGRVMDAINLFKMDLKTLTDQFAEANALKFDFHREEKELGEISSVFKRAEKYCKSDSIKEVDSELNAARKRYETIKPRIVNKLRAYGRVKDTINGLKKLSNGIDESLRECKRDSMDCSQEEEAYGKLDMNRTLLASESFWKDDNFKEALGELERLKGEYEKISRGVGTKITHYNELLARKFPCLKCGKNMNLANQACPSCGANPAEVILELMGDSVNKLEEAAKEIQDAEWLMNMDSEKDGLEEIQIALSSITKQVEKGELDRATSLLTSTKSSQDALVSEMKEKLELYGKLSGKISQMRKKAMDMKMMMEANKRNGMDVKEEDGAYAKANERASLEIIEGLCKSGSFSDASSRLESTLAEYDRITAVLSKKDEHYKGISAKVVGVDKGFKETAALIEQAKAKRIDVSLEERDLRSINPGQLEKVAQSLSPEAEKAVTESSQEVAKIKDSVSRKLEMFSRLEGMASALEDRVKELRALVSKGVTLKLDIKEEHEKFYSIKMDRIKEMLKSCEDIVTLKKELDNSLDTAQWCIASLSDKLASVEDAPKWAETIGSAMKGAEMADLDSLRAIPGEWREWAVQRYMESNPEDAFVIYGNKLIKTMSAERKGRYEEILGEMISSGKVRGGAIVDTRGVVLASAFPEMKDPMPLGAPAVEAANDGKALARTSGITAPGQAVIGTDDFKVIINELGKGVYLLCSLKPKENIAFASIVISSGIKKLQEVA